MNWASKRQLNEFELQIITVGRLSDNDNTYSVARIERKNDKNFVRNCLYFWFGYKSKAINITIILFA